MLQVKNAKRLFLSGLCMLALKLAAQTAVSGIVTDKGGEPLLGVNVYIKGSYDGATTGLDGSFSFKTSDTSSKVLIVSYIGFLDLELHLEGNTQNLNIILKEEITQLNAVVITAGSFNASDEQKREVLKPLDIVTTAGATADIPGALNTLPGTQTVGETGRLFVRGGEGRETKTFIDGVLVHNEYGPAAPNTPSRSRFSPFMFKGMSFSTGGYSAEYGQALSSALILQSKDLSENNRSDISLMSVGMDVSTTRSFTNSSVAGKVQYTNLTPYFELAPQNLKWDKAPEELNGNFAYRHKTSKTGLIKLYTNLSTSDMKLFESDIASPENLLPVSVSNKYAHVNASYRELLSDKWGVRSGLSLTRSNDFASIEMQSREQDLTGYHAKVVADYQHSDRVAVLFGGEVLGRALDQQLTDENEEFNQEFDEVVKASFVETEFFISKSLAFKLGTRVANSNLNDETIIAPRLSTAYKTGEKSQVSLAYGQFHQAAATQVILTDQKSPFEKSTHYIANYQWSDEGQSFRVEAYEKSYDQLVKYENVFDPSSYRFSGDGFARGIDLFWRDNKTIKGMDYWISYSYLDTRRDQRDYPGSFTPAFASKHNVSIVGKKFMEDLKSQVGVTYSFASGRPYNDLNSERFMSGTTPSFHDLSFNISYLYSNQIIVHAMVNNALGINNVFGYEFADQPGANGVYASRAITPPAKRFVFLGVFITLSKNKGINQLPNL